MPHMRSGLPVQEDVAECPAALLVSWGDTTTVCAQRRWEHSALNVGKEVLVECDRILSGVTAVRMSPILIVLSCAVLSGLLVVLPSVAGLVGQLAGMFDNLVRQPVAL